MRNYQILGRRFAWLLFSELASNSTHHRPSSYRNEILGRIQRRRHGNIRNSIPRERRYRDKQHLTLAETRIEQLALKLVEEQEEGDDFRIILDNGQTIGSSEINVQTHMNIKALGKSVERDGAWSALREYFKDLVDNGIVEK